MLQYLRQSNSEPNAVRLLMDVDISGPNSFSMVIGGSLTVNVDPGAVQIISMP